MSWKRGMDIRGKGEAKVKCCVRKWKLKKKVHGHY